jgi:hypothetical protein
MANGKAIICVTRIKSMAGISKYFSFIKRVQSSLHEETRHAQVNRLQIDQPGSSRIDFPWRNNGIQIAWWTVRLKLALARCTEQKSIAKVLGNHGIEPSGRIQWNRLRNSIRNTYSRTVILSERKEEGIKGNHEVSILSWALRTKGLTSWTKANPWVMNATSTELQWWLDMNNGKDWTKGDHVLITFSQWDQRTRSPWKSRSGDWWEIDQQKKKDVIGDIKKSEATATKRTPGIDSYFPNTGKQRLWQITWSRLKILIRNIDSQLKGWIHSEPKKVRHIVKRVEESKPVRPVTARLLEIYHFSSVLFQTTAIVVPTASKQMSKPDELWWT